MKDESVKLRKYENILVISGMGVIAFGLWSVIKAAIYFIVRPFDFASLLPQGESAGLGDMTPVVNGIVLGILLSVLLIDLLLRIYVGRSAIAVGKGRSQKKTVYIILAVIIGLSLVGSIHTSIDSAYHSAKTAVTTVMEEDQSADTAADQDKTVEEQMQDEINRAAVSVFVDVTALLAIVEMIIASVQVRRLRKRLQQRAGQEA